MKTLLAFVFALLVPIAAQAAGTQEQAATAAAKSWLALVDAGNYSQSWKDASSFFQSHVSNTKWVNSVKPTRASLGAVVSREPVHVEMKKSLPGAPDGEYAVIYFKTKFAKKAEATETVTMMMDGGSWKCVGYFIR